MKKILILAANPTDTSRLDLPQEVREIQAVKRQAKYREEVEIISEWAVRVDDLHSHLLHYKPNIVHFCGHGTGDNGLVLENEYGQKEFVSSESLADLFKLFNKNVECVVMNACYSEVQAKAIHEHINCVIGMNYKIGDKAAIQFATGFYNALINAINYQDSFEFGKNLLDLKNITESGIPQIKIKDNSQSLIDSDSTNIKSKQENNMTENNIQGDYIQQDGSFGVGVNKGTINTDKLAGTINEAQSKNLAEAAKEIQELLEQLDKTYDTSTTFGKMQVATETIKTIENNPDLKVRIISALKVGGVKAFEQFLNHPAASFVIGALEDWQKSND